MSETQEQAEGGAAVVDDLPLLDKIVKDGNLARNESHEARAKDLIGSFVEEIVANDAVTVSHDTIGMINERIAQLDELISAQLNAIMHAKEFQKMEATWRGMHFMVMNTETSSSLKLRVLNASKKELLTDLEKAVEFDQSALFKKVYSEEFGTFGGHPYTIMIGDYEFGRHPQDTALMELIAQVAAAAHAPFIGGADPSLFDMDSFTELGNPRDLAKVMESTELVKWRSFREKDDSRYFSLAMPHILLRLPYGPDTKPVEEFNFVEDTDGTDHDKYLWGNACWALGQRVSEAFARHKWCAAIRGAEGGGAVKGLPTHTFKTDDGDIALKCPTEIAITDRREKELSDLGLIPLVHCKGTDYAAFFGAQTVNEPKVYSTDSATANAKISSMLPYILASCRFAHYIKAMMRDKIGSFMTRAQTEKYLNNWITDYVLLDDNADQKTKASYPLRDARIDVTEDPSRPGCYRAVAFLRPHFQLDELSVSLRLVAEIPQPAG